MFNQVIDTGARSDFTSEFTASLPENLTGLEVVSYPKTAPGNHIGAKARWAYQKFNLFRSARYPPYKLAFQSPFKEAFVLSVAGYLAWVAGREVKKVTGKPMTTQFREMAGLWFGQMVDPPSYYAQELFRPRNMDKLSQFLTRFETKNGILRSLNELTPSPYAIDEMSDKALFAKCCAANRIPHVQTLAIIGKDQTIWNVDPKGIDFDLFCKHQKGKGAIGAEAFRYVGPDQFQDQNGMMYSLHQLVSHLRANPHGRSVLMQRWLTNHESICDLAHDSLVTFRVITCMNENDEIEVTDAMLRILVDLEPTWRPAVCDDEFAAPIDLATGRLGLLTGDDMRTCCVRYRNHPVTNAKVIGRVIEHWPAIAAMATRCHSAFSHRLMIGWDIALTPNGPIMLEGNTKFDVMLLQRVHDRAAGHSRFGELLAFHLPKLLQKDRIE